MKNSREIERSMTMFIKFTDCPRMINLNNFDELQIDGGDCGAAAIAKL